MASVLVRVEGLLNHQNLSERRDATALEAGFTQPAKCRPAPSSTLHGNRCRDRADARHVSGFNDEFHERDTKRDWVR